MKILKLQNSKFIKLISISLLICIFTVSCDKPQEPAGEPGDSKEEMLKHILPLTEAVELYKNYGEERIAPLKDSLAVKYGDNFNDTRLVSVNLEVMKAYISYIEERSKELKVKPEGLHFYFGVYSENLESDDKNHQTFFITPSTSNEGVQSGYTVDHEGGTDKIVFIKDFVSHNNEVQSSQVDKASFFNFALREHNGLILNRHGTSPPDGNN